MDGTFFSMSGHSSTMRMPSMRMLSALMGMTNSLSYSTLSRVSKWYSPSFQRKRR